MVFFEKSKKQEGFNTGAFVAVLAVRFVGSGDHGKNKNNRTLPGEPDRRPGDQVGKRVVL